MTQPLGIGYQLEEQLGTSAIGRLWRGLDLSGAPVAVTLLNPDVGADPLISRRFWATRPQLSAARSANVVGIRDLVIDGTTRALVTDWVPGPDLRSALQDHGPVPARELCRIGAGVASGLAALHSSGIAHGNLTLSNVMLDVTDSPTTPKVAGIADSLLLGLMDPYFAAPEVLAGGPPTPQSDLYSLGLLLLSMNSGRPPTPGGPDAALMARYSRTSGRPDRLPEDVWQLIATITEKDPHWRVLTAAQTAQALSLLAAGKSAPMVPPSAHSAVSAPPTRSESPANHDPVGSARSAAPAPSPPAPAAVRPVVTPPPREPDSNWTGPMLFGATVALVALIGVVAILLLGRSPASAPITVTATASRPQTGPGSSTPSAAASTASSPASPSPSATPLASFPSGILACTDTYGARSGTTSCEFAADVYAAAQPMVAAGKTTFEVTAKSPVTNKAYVMNCRPAAGGMTVCTGGNRAQVYLR